MPETPPESAVLDAPDDPARWQVWADWLQLQGDPRGERIALCARGLKKEAAEHLKENAAHLWGAASSLVANEAFTGKTWLGLWEGATPRGFESLDVKWTVHRFGLVDQVTATGLDEQGLLAGAVGGLLASPLGRCTRSLSFELGERFEGPSGQPNYGDVILAVKDAAPGGLRSLKFDAAGYQLSWTMSGALGALWPVLPRLEDLDIRLGSITLGEKIDLPRLRNLEIESGGLGAENVRAIAHANWPSLERLVLWLGCKDYGGDSTMDDLAGFFSRAEAFPALRHLALKNSEIVGPIIPALARAPLLKRLGTLDLSKGILDDAEAQALLEHAPAFAHLAFLDVSESYLSPEMEERLTAAYGTRILLTEQRYADVLRDRAQYGSPDWATTGFRYTVVGE